MRATLQTDGGSRGNPGPAGAGIFLTDENNQVIAEAGYYLGRCTNNVAEYRGLIHGLETASKLGVTDLLIRLDSELIVKQLRREYRVKSPDLKPLYLEASQLLERFNTWAAEHVRREANERADQLANMAMDHRADVHPEANSDPKPTPASQMQPDHPAELAGEIDPDGPACPAGQTAGASLRIAPLTAAGWCPDALSAILNHTDATTSATCSRCGARIRLLS
ncbi:ribonuclease HI family protein [Mucisphaera sp.]|uniref:ribonuclease HI family protein n=1 Tax=Mucisphaera sp. TaxID=2913024 RepID=UPI003D11F4B8